MKKFLIKSFIFFIPVLLVYGLAYIKGYYPIVSNSISFDAKLLEIRRAKLSKVDVMAIGSSTCLNNLNSIVMRDSLAMSYYNFGAWGLQMADLNHLIKSYVSVYQPKYVLLPSNLPDFDLAANSTLPDNFFWGLKIAPLYYIKNYTSYKDIIRRKNELSLDENDQHNFGYLRFDNYGGVSLNVSKQNANQERLEFIDHLLEIFPNKNTSRAYQNLDSLAAFLTAKKVKLIFIQFPYADNYIKTQQKQTIVFNHFNACKRIVENRGGIYLNFEQPNLYPDSLFADPLHFNEKGSALLTKRIVSKLKLLMQNRSL